MTDAQLIKWASRYDLKPDDVKKLRNLVVRRVREMTHALNGDTHFRGKDKDSYSKAWEQDSDKTDAKIVKLSKKMGFTGIDFGVGLYPAFHHPKEQFVHIPM
jgi:hypothetical protein